MQVLRLRPLRRTSLRMTRWIWEVIRKREGSCYSHLEFFAMADNAAFPYETRLNILYKPLELIDVHAVPGANEFKWFNQTLCKVNDSVVRMAVIEGGYPLAQIRRGRRVLLRGGR